MTKKEYIEKIENLILQRIKYHAPKLQGQEVDYSLLEAIGIDASLPIFMIKKPINKVLFKAIENVKKNIKFNLILIEKPLFNVNKLKSLENSYVLYKDEIGDNLNNTLELLNINYMTKSDFKNDLKDEFIKINGQKLIFDYFPYFYSKKMMSEGMIFDVRNFLLNGKNIMINILNTKKIKQKAKIEINIPLPRGYYLFKKSRNCVEIKNLISKEVAFFNFNFQGIKLAFSNMAGIESCTFACINACCELTLLPQQKQTLYFNFGENKYCLYNAKLIEYFFLLSQKKFNEIFDIKVQTRDNDFDNNFNRYLPQKIWEKWQNFDVDEESINKWLKIKSQIVKIGEKGDVVRSNLKGLKEVKFFRNSGWKRVFILHNNSNYMFANNVKYFNYNLLTKEIFKKNNEIYLSFAD